MVINIAAVVYAIPVVAVLVAILRLALNKPLRGFSLRRPARGSALPGIVVGVIGFAFGAAMFASADADRRAYVSDPTCTAGFGYVAGVGACRVSSSYVQQWYWTGGRHATRRLVLRNADGTQLDIGYGRDLRSNLWHGLYDTGDRIASVQYYKNRIVLIETRSGLAATDAEPTSRVTVWAFFGVGMGLVGIFSALRASRVGLFPIGTRTIS